MVHILDRNGAIDAQHDLRRFVTDSMRYAVIRYRLCVLEERPRDVRQHWLARAAFFYNAFKVEWARRLRTTPPPSFRQILRSNNHA